MIRSDLSPSLIHFTKGETSAEAFGRLRKILTERRLLGGNGHIKGGYKCVCFSEAPLAVLTEKFYQRYSSFGIMVSKEWLFARGGRPVIYQTEQKFGDLPESHRWRHVLYELR